jgi:hypothetical protein
MTNPTAILTYLIERQASDGLTGRAMAARLGMREQEWSRIRNGHRPLGPLQRERALIAFPELRDQIFEVAS